MTKVHACLCSSIHFSFSSSFYWNKLLAVCNVHWHFILSKLCTHTLVCNAFTFRPPTWSTQIKPNNQIYTRKTRSHSSSTTNAILIFNLIPNCSMHNMCAEYTLMFTQLRLAMNNVPGSRQFIMLFCHSMTIVQKPNEAENLCKLHGKVYRLKFCNINCPKKMCNVNGFLELGTS